MVEADLHEYYGVDVGEPGLLEQRSWRWMRTRILGLLSTPKSRVHRHFFPPEQPKRTRR